MIQKIDHGIAIMENVLLIAGILSATVVLFLNVILRYFFHSGLVWAEEYARYAIVWIVCGGCGAAVRTNSHMRITALPDALAGSRIRNIIDIIVNLTCLAFSLMLVISGIRLTGSMIINHQVSPALGVPLWTVYLSLPFGGSIMCFRFLLLLAGNFTRIGEPEKKGASR
jgi:C4-dicarboxylate transporter DctQ subunit